MARLNKLDGVNYGYGQLELNQFAAPRDGRIEAQLPLDSAKFHKAYANYKGTNYNVDVPAEVGMILVVDKAGRKITAAAPTGKEMYALNYSTEHMYDEREPQLRKFCMYPAETGYDFRSNLYDDFYPRMGFLAIGDRFTTNTVEVGDLTKETLGDALGQFAGPNADGYWELKGEEVPANGPVAQVVEVTTMPDGAPAVKLMVVRV